MKSVPQRFILSVVLCLGTINLYSQRICLSITVLCMTNHSATTTNKNFQNFTSENNMTDKKCGASAQENHTPLEDGPFLWDGHIRGMILGVYFWGYLFGQLPLGWITQRYTARYVVLVNLLLLSGCTTLLPLAAYTHVYLFYTLRVIIGFTSAAWFPGFYQVWAAWAPQEERGILVGFSYAGVHIGNAMTLPISGVLCRSSLGWPSVFYFYGALSFIYTILWAIMVYDTPQVHPRISTEEKKFIISKCGDTTVKTKKKTEIPIKAILTSVPVWAFVAINVGFDWNGYFFLTSMPAYMREVLQFDIKENAGLSALPYAGLWVGQIFSGWLSDWIISRKLLSVGIVRKLMTMIGTFGPGIVLIVMSFFDCNFKYVVVILFTFGLMVSSGVFSGGLLNPIEMSPRHAGLIFAGSNTLSAATGFIGPLVVSALTPNKSYEEWRHVFYLCAAIYAVSGLIFLFFSSSNVQPWAMEPSDLWSNTEMEIKAYSNGEKELKSNVDGSFSCMQNDQTTPIFDCQASKTEMARKDSVGLRA